MPQRYPSVRRSFLDLTRDAVTLAELQAKLASREAKEGLRGLFVPVVAIAVAITTGLGAAPVALIAVAETIFELSECNRALSYVIAATIGIVFAIATGLVAWLLLRRQLVIFEGSIEELKNNVAWFKRVIGTSP